MKSLSKHRNLLVCLLTLAVLALVGARNQGIFEHQTDSPARADLERLARKGGRPGYRAYIDPKTGARRAPPARRARKTESRRAESKGPRFNVEKMPDGSYKLHVNPDRQPRERLHLRPGDSSAKPRLNSNSGRPSADDKNQMASPQ